MTTVETAGLYIHWLAGGGRLFNAVQQTVNSAVCQIDPIKQKQMNPYENSPECRTDRRKPAAEQKPQPLIPLRPNVSQYHGARNIPYSFQSKK
jgi:hypothetical protein